MAAALDHIIPLPIKAMGPPMGPIPFFMNCGCHTMLPLLMPLPPPICPICPIGLPLPIFPIPLPMPPIMFIMGPIPQAPIILGSGQTRFVANFLWKILFQRQATIHLQLLKSTVLFYRFQSQNHDAHIFTMPSTLPKCSKDTSVKVDDMSIATPKKVTKSWKPVKIWRKHHLYHPGNTFLFFWGVLYITSVYFTWYILLYRAKPPKNQFPYLPNFEFLRAIHIRSIKNIQKLHPPNGCLFGGLLHGCFKLPIC